MDDRRAAISREETRCVFEQWFAAWSSGDVPALISLLAEDCTWDDVPNAVHRGKQEAEALARATYQMVPDLHLEILNVLIGEGFFVAEYQATGTNAGGAPGIPAIGNRFCMRGAAVLELRDGKIHRYASYWDTNSITRPFSG
ncbi:nuclear transport factor 2 family protein [Sorangium sp. So ce1335]|uniref:nuclear transport factor 2 family protein n=1 Tax=Sorangium sp. So ce1335 TaxID=3133335 RepID=UPI003F5EA248